MRDAGRPVSILIADDDAEERLLAKKALEEARLANGLHFVKDGEELLDYLNHRGQYTDSETFPRPGLILLDLNMPRMDGHVALMKIRTDPDLRQIPVVVLTTSKAEEDIVRTYLLGASSFITKPVKFESLVEVMKVLQRYWFEIVELPHHR